MAISKRFSSKLRHMDQTVDLRANCFDFTLSLPLSGVDFIVVNILFWATPLTVIMVWVEPHRKGIWLFFIDIWKKNRQSKKFANTFFRAKHGVHAGRI